MAVLARGKTFGPTETVTNDKLHQLVDLGSVSGIVNANIAAGAGILDTKLDTISTPGKVRTAAIEELNNGTVNPTNLLSNWNFASFSLGDNAVPDGYTLSGAGASVSKAPTVYKVAPNSVAMSRSGADALLYQSVHSNKSIYYWLANDRTLCAGCWVLTAVAGVARIYVNFGGSSVNYYSAYHTGDSSWQFLTVKTGIVPGGTTSINVVMNIANTDALAYFSGIGAFEGQSLFAPSPKPAEEGVWADYSAVSTIVGFASFIQKFIYTKKVGNTRKVQGVLYGTSDSTTITFTLPAARFVNASWTQTFNSAGNAFDNTSTYKPNAVLTLVSNSNIVTAYTTGAGAGWTASNSKFVEFSFEYEEA